MIPYVQSYCRSFDATLTKLQRLVEKRIRIACIATTDGAKQRRILRCDERIKGKMLSYAEDIKRWRDELDRLSLYVCRAAASGSCIDVPFKDPQSGVYVGLCITCESSYQSVHWHLLTKTYDDRRRYPQPLRLK